MTRNIFVFLATFVVGAFAAFTTRAVMHKPHAEVTEHRAPEHAPMVSNPLTPASPAKPDGNAGKASAAKPAAGEHDGHHAAAATKAVPATETVNTVCAICGMKVDPNVPTLEYEGKKIGFGCKMCAPKFKADPDKYGPLYLRNE